MSYHLWLTHRNLHDIQNLEFRLMVDRYTTLLGHVFRLRTLKGVTYRNYNVPLHEGDYDSIATAYRITLTISWTLPSDGIFVDPDVLRDQLGAFPTIDLISRDDEGFLVCASLSLNGDIVPKDFNFNNVIAMTSIADLSREVFLGG